MPENRKSLRNIYVLVSLALLAALQIVMTRLLKIDLGFARINLGSVATIMAGLWFGPVCGALTGGIADLVGSFLQGYAPNPVIMLAAVLWGVIPALALPFTKGQRRMRRNTILSIGIAAAAVICTIILNTAGLVLFYGYDIRVILPARAVQALVMTPVYCVLVCCLYYSPVTAYIREHILTRRTAAS